MIEKSQVQGVAGEFSSEGSAFCADSYFWYLFHPNVTAIACKKKIQVTAKNAGGRLQLNMHAAYVCDFK